MNQVKGTGKNLYSLLNLTKENPSRTVETKITLTSDILLGMYSPRNADISVPQVFHFLTWEPYSPKPGAWSRVKGAVFWSDSGLDLGKGPSRRLRICSCCSNASLISMHPKQNLKIILLQIITYPLFPNSRHHLSSGGKGLCSQILRTPTHLWGFMFNLAMILFCARMGLGTHPYLYFTCRMWKPKFPHSPSIPGDQGSLTPELQVNTVLSLISPSCFFPSSHSFGDSWVHASFAKWYGQVTMWI